MLKRSGLAMLVYLALTVVAFWGFLKWPTSYLPQEDMGHFMTNIQLPPGASLERTRKVVDAMEKEILKEVPQIGLILLLGMSAKNAILIVEFARDYHKQGVSVIQAAQEAGQVRFRPIMMTALAFVFGVLPMLFATGPGANSRIALGTAIVFGMAMNAFIGTLFVPTFWAFMQNLSDKIRNKAAKTTNNSVVQPMTRSHPFIVSRGYKPAGTTGTGMGMEGTGICYN